MVLFKMLSETEQLVTTRLECNICSIRQSYQTCLHSAALGIISSHLLQALRVLVVLLLVAINLPVIKKIELKVEDKHSFATLKQQDPSTFVHFFKCAFTSEAF